MRKAEYYICEKCHSAFKTLEEAVECEGSHITPKEVIECEFDKNKKSPTYAKLRMVDDSELWYMLCD